MLLTAVGASLWAGPFLAGRRCSSFAESQQNWVAFGAERCLRTPALLWTASKRELSSSQLQLTPQSSSTVELHFI